MSLAGEVTTRLTFDTLQLKTVRAGGWIKNRQDSSSASSTPVTSPAKATDTSESDGTVDSPEKAVSTAPVTGETSPVESQAAVPRIVSRTRPRIFKPTKTNKETGGTKAQHFDHYLEVRVCTCKS
ncbi:hypothetical protein GQ600_1145 [Phytophthora cactorum]|nr:hypothetical protein GQ600_1145 [Phytophthora cactorum]